MTKSGTKRLGPVGTFLKREEMETRKVNAKPIPKLENETSAKKKEEKSKKEAVLSVVASPHQFKYIDGHGPVASALGKENTSA